MPPHYQRWRYINFRDSNSWYIYIYITTRIVLIITGTNIDGIISEIIHDDFIINSSLHLLLFHLSFLFLVQIIRFCEINRWPQLMKWILDTCPYQYTSDSISLDNRICIIWHWVNIVSWVVHELRKKFKSYYAIFVELVQHRKCSKKKIQIIGLMEIVTLRHPATDNWVNEKSY